MKTIYIASDHAGFECKKKTLSFLKETFVDFEFIDLGTHSEDRVDYPNLADDLCKKLLDQNLKDLNKATADQCFGVLICGSGQGMAIRANKYKDIRAALCWNEESAKLARAHNHANVLCLGARLVSDKDIKNICRSFLTTQEEEGRHLLRVKKLSEPTV
jgi:ribose 5-phosphate isomerase B